MDSEKLNQMFLFNSDFFVVFARIVHSKLINMMSRQDTNSVKDTALSIPSYQNHLKINFSSLVITNFNCKEIFLNHSDILCYW